jgi:O-antigen/teichoic acid export membrane protein
LETQASVAKGATSLYVANVVVLVANTLYFLVLTNFLHSTLNVGIVTALNIMIWLLVTVCIFAQPITVQSPVPAPLAVLKFLPELIAKNARTGAAKLFGASLSLVGLFGGALAMVLFVWPNLVVPLIGGQDVLPDYIRLSAVDVLVLSLGQVCLGTLIALRDMRRATIYIILWSAARYALASLLLIPYSITGVLSGFIIGDTVLLLPALWRSYVTVHGLSDGSTFSLANLSQYSLYTLFSALIGFAINQADKLFTLAQQGLPELAIYNVAIVAASFTGFAPYALLTVLLPAFSALHASNRLAEMKALVRTYTRYVSIVVLPIAVGFASVTEVALRIFGPAYTSGLVPSVIVSVATGLTAIGAVYAGVLLASGELRWYTAANVLGLVGLLVVSGATIPFFGLSGPALGRATLMILAASVYAIATQRKGFLELDMKAFATAIGSSAIMGVVVFAALWSLHSFYLKLVALPLLVVVGGFIYLGLLRAVRLLTVDDVEFVLGIVPRGFQPWIQRIARLAGVEK